MRDFIQILESLEIRHSFQYARDLFLGQSKNRSLWGIKKLLEKYGVKVTAIRVESKSLNNISFPFIYQSDEGIFAMTRKPEDQEAFEEKWNGIALTCDTSEAREPYYLLHKVGDVVSENIRWIVFSAALLILFTHLTNPFSLFRLLLAVFSLAGIHFSWKSAVNECSGSCSVVTESSAGKIFGYSLSVVGMAWFGISILTIVLIPQWLPLWSIIAVVAVAMPLWSILWQAVVLKAWCRNCLAVQAATVCCAVTVIAGGGLSPDAVTWRSVAALPSAFLMAVFALDIVFNYYKTAIHPPFDISVLKMMHNPQLRDQIISMGNKVESEGFPELWHLNPDGKDKVFVALSLRCSHCKDMYSRILEAQRKGRLAEYHVTFALSGTGGDKIVVEVLAAAALHKGVDAALELLAQWYDNQNPKAFGRLASRLPVDGVKEMLDEMDKITERMNIQALPFVALNGREVVPAVFWADVELKN